MNPLPSRTPPPVKRRILVIDDEPTVRATLLRYLTILGHTVTLTSSGEEGLTLLGNLQPDLIFLDITMPGKEGLSTLRDLHEKHEQLPVVMMATPEDVPKAHIALNCGASDFIAKPVDLTALKRILQIHFKTPGRSEP